MSEQFRATDENWADLEGYGGAVPNCLRELRDRVMCMDACIRDIYTQIDELKKRCDNNYIKAAWIEDRVEKLEQPVSGPSRGIDLAAAVLAGADGPAPEPPAGELVLKVMLSLRPSWGKDELVRDKASAAILAVADWAEQNIPDPTTLSGRSFAQRLRREVEQ